MPLIKTAPLDALVWQAVADALDATSADRLLASRDAPPAADARERARADHAFVAVVEVDARGLRTDPIRQIGLGPVRERHQSSMGTARCWMPSAAMRAAENGSASPGR